jgi:hypothetical protein
MTAVEDFISALEGKEIASTPSSLPPEPGSDSIPHKKLFVSDLVKGFWSEGWFSTARGLSEVHSELSRRGYI